MTINVHCSKQLTFEVICYVVTDIYIFRKVYNRELESHFFFYTAEIFIEEWYGGACLFAYTCIGVLKVKNGVFTQEMAKILVIVLC